MNLNIKITNLQVGDDMRKHLEKKFEALGRIIDLNAGNVLMHVELSKTSEHHRSGNIFSAEANLRTDGHNFRAVAEGEDILSAIDVMKDELLREVKEGKAKFMTKVKKGGKEIKEKMREEDANTDM